MGWESGAAKPTDAWGSCFWAAHGEIFHHGTVLQAGLGPISFSLFIGQAWEGHCTEEIKLKDLAYLSAPRLGCQVKWKTEVRLSPSPCETYSLSPQLCSLWATKRQLPGSFTQQSHFILMDYVLRTSFFSCDFFFFRIRNNNKMIASQRLNRSKLAQAYQQHDFLWLHLGKYWGHYFFPGRFVA